MEERRRCHARGGGVPARLGSRYVRVACQRGRCGAAGSVLALCDTHALQQPLDIARFKGEDAIDARLVDGPTRDFNLMLRRGAAAGEVEVWRGDAERTLSADVLLLFCAEGPMEVTSGTASPVRLDTDDTLRIDAAQALRLTVKGSGALLVIGIRYA